LLTANKLWAFPVPKRVLWRRAALDFARKWAHYVTTVDRFRDAGKGIRPEPSQPLGVSPVLLHHPRFTINTEITELIESAVRYGVHCRIMERLGETFEPFLEAWKRQGDYEPSVLLLLEKCYQIGIDAAATGEIRSLGGKFGYPIYTITKDLESPAIS
jgi:hypothetical protein